jgi:dihydrofolate reductase
MRKVIVSEYVTLDGVMEDPGGSEGTERGGWSFQFWNEESAMFKFDELFASDALLLGRVTYQGFADAWQSMNDEADFADRMNSLPKFVVSTTLEEVKWNNSRLIKGNIAGEVYVNEAAARSGHLDRRQWRACTHVDAARPHR